MSPHQSSQSTSHTPKNSSVLTANPLSWRSKSDSEISGVCYDSFSNDTNGSSLAVAGNHINYDIKRPVDQMSRNPYNYYEIKVKQCDGGNGELDPSLRHNSNNEMHFWSYPNLTQQSLSSHNRLINSPGNGVKRCVTPKHSSSQRIPFFNGLTGRGYGRSSCWNRRKVNIL